MRVRKLATQGSWNGRRLILADDIQKTGILLTNQEFARFIHAESKPGRVMDIGPDQAKTSCLVNAFGRYLVCLTDELDRIDSLAIPQDFEVQVRAGGATRVTHQSDSLTLSDLFTYGDQVFFIMRVAG